MGNRKQKWTEEEEEALKVGVAKHGAGKWKIILVDSELAPKFMNRSNVDLKDKWRNMCVSQGQGGRDNSTTPKAIECVSSAVAPNIQNNSPVFSSREKANDHPPRSPQNMKNVPKYNAMIFDALSSLKDPNGSDIGAIADFIEVQHCYKIKDVALATKTPSPKQKDVRPKPLQQSSLTISREMKAVEDAAKTAARWIAEAENKAFVMSAAVKESERVSQIADDADAMLTLAQELYVKCKACYYLYIV
ncbi:telomere repeat-binding factor 4 [Phtheirospermum japonicum]|uniref:MYB transcription factor n=1 Tax=Phtheirospermum japonicum TaxID=374723 RepID=A0A830CZK2_9LAMI|nr:telomere repeat-binding factor 4 [Phtheirospermum japonicum]